MNHVNHDGLSALSLLLDCAQKRELIFGTGIENVTPRKTPSKTLKLGLEAPSSSNSTTSTKVASASHSGRNFWVSVAYLLLEKGALWNKSKITHGQACSKDSTTDKSNDKSIVDVVNHRNQLQLLFSGPLPPSKDINKFISILRHALLIDDVYEDEEDILSNDMQNGNQLNQNKSFYQFDLNSKDKYGYTVFDLAKMRHSNSYEYEIIESILNSRETPHYVG